ncbi:hypothetical protein PG993_012447 [Apiospora rasikravindrae]|uniref:Mid2 domain-containing protein n=1 Tax=Apiospora rasikravindrae TaxID=990691 RepID=A0ABR1S495_9PEZI
MPWTLRPTPSILSVRASRWSGPRKTSPYPLSLLHFQNTRPAEDAEHVFQRGSWQWTVFTNQTLDHSNVFGFILFEGKQSSEAISREYNITASSNGSSQPQPPPPPAASTTAHDRDSTSSAGPSTTASTLTTATPSSSSSAGGGLSEEQKLGLGIGLGVGIPLSALLGFGCLLLWGLLKRQKNKEHQSFATSGGSSNVYSSGDKYSGYGHDDMESQQQHQ